MAPGDVQQAAPAGGQTVERREPAPVTPQGGAEAQRAAVVGTAEAQRELRSQVVPIERLTSLVISGDHDFEGTDRSDEDTKKNPHFLRIQQGLQAFLEKSKGSKPEFFQPWAMAAVDFLVAEAASYKGMTGHPMGYDDVTKALEALEDPAKTGNSKLPGIGSLETWIKTQPALAEKFAAWKTGEESRGTVEAAKAKIPLGVVNFPGVKTRLEALAKSTNVEKDTEALTAFAAAIFAAHENASGLEAKLAQISCCPNLVLEKVRAAKTAIENCDKDQVATLSESVNEIQVADLPGIEKLAGLLAAKEVAQTLRDKLTAEVKEGKKTVEDAIKELEGAKKKSDSDDDEPETGDDAPLVDKAMTWLKKMGRGMWKTTLGGLIAAITTFTVGISKWSWGRKFFGNKLMSNKLLAQHGVKEAEQIYRAEQEFKKFGLTRDLANELADSSTEDAIEELKKREGDTTTAEIEKVKLRQLIGQLEAKDASSSKLTLAEFVGTTNPAWENVQYKATQAAPQTAVAQAPVQAPTQLSVPATPSAAPPTPTPTTAQT